MARSFQQAVEDLKTEGYTVTMKGTQFVVSGPRIEPKKLSKAEVMHYADRYAPSEALIRRVDLTDAPAPAPAAELLPGSSPAPAYLSWPALPLIELMDALDAHAGRLPTPLAASTPIPIPAGLPERMLMPIDMLVAGRYQPRQEFEQAAIDELAASIAEHGILNPLLVFANEHGRVELIAGERRMRAARQAGLGMLPIEFRPYTLLQIAEVSGIDNIQRAQLSPLEEGRYYSRLITELKISENQLAQRLGQNRAAIQQRRAIAAAAPELQQALTEGKISFTQARAIAQAAPGEHGAQKKALKQVIDWLGFGRKISENDARTATEVAVLETATKSLQKFGWTIAKPYGYTLIWAKGERPRTWTGAEMLAAVQEQRRPSLEAPPAEDLDSALLAELEQRYNVTRDYHPWIGLADGYSATPVFYAPSELRPVRDAAIAEIAALQTKAQASGWTLTATGSRSYRLAHPDGATQHIMGYGELVKAIDTLPKLKTKPSSGSSTYAPQKKTCIVCGKETTDYQYFENGHACTKKCLPKLRAQAEARRKTTQEAVDTHAGAWLLSAPLHVLHLLFLSMGWQAWQALGRPQPNREAMKQELAKLSAQHLARGIASTMGGMADSWRDAGFANFPELTEHNVVMSFSSDEIEPVTRQAPRAVQLLNEEGYATIAELVKATFGALTASMASNPDTDAEPAAVLSGKLGIIDDQLATIEQDWTRGFAPSLDALDTLGDELNRWVEDPEISDADYEARTERLRVLYQRKLAEAEAVAA